ncbi:triphosphoribosyl-dephospho-CoA synthase [Xanthobacter aminoxidans]|uniref:triphosphoribosyl-dephospho-CoA synthase n=1 Tax=Xanthobacter aminoxidans TaxID=186280 RepID=UPI0020231569|nr:triphosphoribosyl-dephospho-CoA synthase [Xanthobacter aminoxidans]MCL8381800.1 triphosphoribosyl-dephospho-CoA synthase [Xanthobacter aminoxidans]
MRALAPAEVAEAFRAACLAELSALKPGNVHVFAAGHGMETTQFEAAAAAAAPAIARAGASVGARVLAAVEASLAVAGCNTNLGIILLCAPLAVAAEGGGPLRDQLVQVLDGLDLADAENAFHAIAAASPGGLGASAEADVRAPASVTLKAAMALAADRDAIARQYVTGYADLFALGVPALSGGPLERRRIEDAYLAFLATLPDSHIARKFGPEQAEVVRQEAVALRGGLSGLSPGERHDALLAFDTSLKSRGLNPGTSADLTVASIFAALIEQQARG